MFGKVKLNVKLNRHLSSVEDYDELQNIMGNKKMKHLFYVLFLFLGICKLAAAEFDPSACLDLKVKIFQVNKDWAVFYASADSYSHSGMGFEYSALQYQLFKNRYYTALHLEMGAGKSSRLRFMMPIQTNLKNVGYMFSVGTKGPWLWSKKKTFELAVDKAEKGVLVFESYADSELRNPLQTMKINLSDNSATLSGKPDRKLKVCWYINKLVLEGLPKGNDTFYIDCGTSSSGYYRNIDGGVTVLKYPVGSFLKIFPVYERFYLKGLE